MFKLTLKITIRNLRKNLLNTCINIGGMTVAMAAFLMITLYVKYEKEYDSSNPNYERIYAVGRNVEGTNSDLTSARFAKAIKEHFPEVDRVGKIKYTNFEFAIASNQARIYVKNVLSADFEASRILNFQVSDNVVNAGKSERIFFLSDGNLKTLFPEKRGSTAELVKMGPASAGLTGTIHGTYKVQRHSNITFDGLALAADISSGQDSTDNSYKTFIQVKPNADIAGLTAKINALYALQNKSAVNKSFMSNGIYLDPLKALHLEARSASGSGAMVVDVIMYFGILVLLLACINYINMSLAQSNSRAREIGVKKVLGSDQRSLIVPFVLEIFIQCSVAMLLAFILAEFLLPVLNNRFEVQLSIWHGDSNVVAIMLLTLFGVTLLSALYPALLLSSKNPAMLLKGNYVGNSQNQLLKKALLVLQFTIAIAFIVGLFIVSRQLNYMQTQEKGFSVDQVVYIRNIAYFDKQKDFEPLKEKIMKISGVKSVAVSNHIPTAPKGSPQRFSIHGREGYINAVAVSHDFFKTLGIKLAAGRLFSDRLATDSTSAILLNESAVKKYDISDPVGKLIRICNVNYQIIGVVQDFKSDGFEKLVEPTVYSISSACAEPKMAILIKIKDGKMSDVLHTLKSDWSKINKRDGDDFRYDFMDLLYGSLFKKQEQLLLVFRYLSILTILVALGGLFAYSRYLTNLRLKEIAVRKILGASNTQLLTLLNGYFFWMVLLANGIAAPLVLIYAKGWLRNFAYKQDISVQPFLLTALITLFLSGFIVSLQVLKAIRANPVTALKYE